MGAFTLATENGIPICPVALKGVRDVWRGSEWLLSPGKLMVTIKKPIDPQQEDGALMTKLRDKVRSIIAKYSGKELL